jgi:hypothetical protein
MKEGLSQELYKYLDEHRSIHASSVQLRGWLEQATSVVERRERLVMWLTSVGAARSNETGAFLSSAEVASFLVKLGMSNGGMSVLDPACGAGLLLSIASEQLCASVSHGIEVNSSAAQLAELLLPPPAKVFRGDTLTGSFPLEEQYDLIISEPPFGLRLETPYRAPNGGEALTDAGDAILCWSAPKLTAKGRAVFLLSASCLGRRGARMWKSLAAQGVYVKALIHVPSGLLKATPIESYIAVLDRTHREKVFTAQFGVDGDLQSQVAKNFEADKPGKKPAQGRLVDLSTFRGFKAFEATERLQEIATRKRLQPVPMQCLVKSHEVLVGSEASAVDAANDVYLPLTGRCEAVLHPDALAKRSGKVVRLVINGEFADARFVAASLNSEIGRLFIESVSPPSGMLKRVSVELLLQGIFYRKRSRSW